MKRSVGILWTDRFSIDIVPIYTIHMVYVHLQCRVSESKIEIGTLIWRANTYNNNHLKSFYFWGSSIEWIGFSSPTKIKLENYQMLICLEVFFAVAVFYRRISLIIFGNEAKKKVVWQWFKMVRLAANGCKKLFDSVFSTVCLIANGCIDSM